MQIYIHIPFCEQKCDYCRFASVGISQEFLIEKYVRYLCKEITDSTCNNSQKIVTIYFGGGTPGVLSLKQLERIFTTLRQKYIFSNDIEISLESTPDKVTVENIQGWSKFGVTRLSMGVQTLNNKSLQAIGRGNKGDIDIALKNIDTVFSNNSSTNLEVSLDFIIGLPHVEKGETKKDIQYILEKYSFVKHVSTYLLEDYYNEDKIIETSFDKKTYPDNWDSLGVKEEDYLNEYSEVKKYLETKGFNRYEISNYAKAGYECKHNQGYWNHSEILAFGLGAYRFVDGIRYANSEKFGEYYKGIKIHETTLSEEDIFLETVMFQLRTSGLVEEVYSKINRKKLDYYISEKFLEKKSNKIILLDKGVLVMDYILSEIV
ncbi:radical SAM family heme chaperone HemW [Candidatus Gracilibacteria bacterium]|nr:radical SAM family heme chaperone HemW [Candidatus Gracilibacteria bacterium]